MTLYRIDLPYTSPPKSLNLNARVHWAQKAKAAAEVRQTVTWLVKAAGVPKCEYMAVQVFWAPGDRRKRDPDNLAAFEKPIFDAIARGRSDLVGLDLVPDDSPKYMDKRRLRILTPDDTNEVGMWLSITTHGEVVAA